MEKEKSVDASWKESAAKSKEQIHAEDSSCEEHTTGSCSCSHEGEPQEGRGNMEVNFLNYVTSMGFQAMIFLGEVPNPMSNEVEKSIDQAKFLIDTLVMLRDKTKGNLSDQEEKFINSTIYEIQMKYVEIVKKEKE